MKQCTDVQTIYHASAKHPYNWHKTSGLLLATAICITALSGCSSGNSGPKGKTANGTGSGTQRPEGKEEASSQENPDGGAQDVTLTVWGAQEDAALMEQVIQGFEQEYRGQADFSITYEVQGESSCKDALLGGLEEGADVFTFADDQLNALAAAGAVEPVANADEIRTEHLERAVEAACVGDELYAYPLTADNGYFLYYNKEYFTEQDVRSLDQILEIAAKNHKFFSMDWTSAWYVYSFFGNTGLETGLNEDGITNYCTWNQTGGAVEGVDVAQAMLDIAASPGFSSRPDGEFLAGVQDGSIIVGVSGVWNAVGVAQAWGEAMGACKLPEYTCGGQQIQMASFSGCKLIGVNAYSKHPDWAAKLAEWIVSGPNQQLRFEMRGQGPSNKQAAESPQVQGSAAIAALLDQSEFSQLQRIGGKFWDPVAAFAANMEAGNPDGKDLQAQLDEMAEGIMAR